MVKADMGDITTTGNAGGAVKSTKIATVQSRKQLLVIEASEKPDRFQSLSGFCIAGLPEPPIMPQYRWNKIGSAFCIDKLPQEENLSR
jgi:hypothetical protein